MNNILVYRTHEDVHPALVKYLHSNLAIRRKIGNEGREKERIYREQTGYDKKIRPESTSRTFIELSSVHLPNDKREQVWAGVGEEFQLTCAVYLGFCGDNYKFSADCVRPDCPTPINQYSSIKELVDEVNAALVKQATIYHGATIKPFIYTVKQRKGLTVQENDILKENLEELEKGNLASKIKKEFKGLMEIELGAVSVPVRGLNIDERAEFESLFYK